MIDEKEQEIFDDIANKLTHEILITANTFIKKNKLTKSEAMIVIGSILRSLLIVLDLNDTKDKYKKEIGNLIQDCLEKSYNVMKKIFEDRRGSK